MTAILAIAALHHSRVSGYSNLYNAMTLHDKCLSMIVPMLSDSNLANDDSVLMTTTILHLYDGLECKGDLKNTRLYPILIYLSSSWQRLTKTPQGNLHLLPRGFHVQFISTSHGSLLATSPPRDI